MTLEAGRNSPPRLSRVSDGDGGKTTSIDKALEVCEALSGTQRGLTVTQLSRTLRLPAATVHRLLAVLRRRGYVGQDEDTARYSLTLKMLDLSFRLLGRSEVRLHAYPVVREFVLRTGVRAFIAVPAGGEVTYVWAAGPDAVAMYTAYGRQMPGHCSIYIDQQAARRLSCLRLERGADVARATDVVVRFGTLPSTGQPRLNCTCAPVFDYTGREVARVGLFNHAAQDGALLGEGGRSAWDLAHLVSLRLGHLPAAAVGL
jgi:DNA-binding IclR family transcriptional regulator